MLNDTERIAAKKPSLGLTPRGTCDCLRAKEIIEAMYRYVQTDKKFPREWLDELVEIHNRERKD